VNRTRKVSWESRTNFRAYAVFTANAELSSI